MSNFFLFMLSFVWRLSWNFPIAQMASVISLLKRFFQILIYWNEWEGFFFYSMQDFCVVFLPFWIFKRDSSYSCFIWFEELFNTHLLTLSSKHHALQTFTIFFALASSSFVLWCLFGFSSFVLWFILSFLSQFSSL